MAKLNSINLFSHNICNSKKNERDTIFIKLLIAVCNVNCSKEHLSVKNFGVMEALDGVAVQMRLAKPH